MDFSRLFLVEELAILGDSIEALVEASDDLQITVTGDDGSAEFLYAGLGADEPGQPLSAEARGTSPRTIRFFSTFAGQRTPAPLTSAQHAVTSAFENAPQIIPRRSRTSGVKAKRAWAREDRERRTRANERARRAR